MGVDSADSPVASHEMLCEAETSAEVLFVCVHDECGRRVVVGKSRPHLTVVNRGDFSIRHSGSVGGVAMDDVQAA
jgi:hypothetical protein